MIFAVSFIAIYSLGTIIVDIVYGWIDRRTQERLDELAKEQEQRNLDERLGDIEYSMFEEDPS